MHHFQHHIGDYDSATTHLSWDEDMAYTRLLRAYYRNEKPLPNDIDAVCRIARARSKDERAAVQTVLEEFFTLFPNGWRNKRADVEIEKFQAKSAKAKSSANARWEEEKSNALAMRSHSDGNALAMLTANRQPLTANQESPQGDSKVAALPEVAAAWNEIPGVTHIRMMTKKRQAALKSRLADPTWVDDWKDGIERVRNSSFCCGGGDTGWQADIDWFLKPDTLTKILEGKYDDRDASPPVDDRLPYMTQAEIDAHNAAFRASKERHQHG